MPIQKSYRLLGLNLRDNRTSSVEEVSCAQAENVYARDAGELTTRPPLRAAVDDTTPRMGGSQQALVNYASVTYAVVDGRLVDVGTANDVINYMNVPPLSEALPPTLDSTASFAEAGGSLLMRTSRGVWALDSTSSKIRPAGLPRPPRPFTSAVDPVSTWAGLPVWLPPGGRAAYRTVLGLNTPNGRIVLSAPSDRVEVVNTSLTETRLTVVRLYLPAELHSENTYFIQIYRSATSTTGPADDEMSQVGEVVLTLDNITQGWTDFADIAHDLMRGVPLYSNERQEGGLEVNDEPPPCLHLATFADCAFYLGISRNRMASYEMLANLSNGDTVTVTATGPGGFSRADTYTARSSLVDVSTNTDFYIFSDGTATENAQRTLADLAECINLQGHLYKHTFASVSTQGGVGGTLALRPVGKATNLTVTGSAGAKPRFSPQLGDTAAYYQETKPGRIYFSKPGLHEAVPPINYLDTHDAGSFLGAGVVGGSLFVLRTDGVWRLTGTGPENFEVSPFESGYVLTGSGTFAVLGERMFCASTSGILMGGESGFRLISDPVEPLRAYGTPGWMVADHSRQLLLHSFFSPALGRRLVLVYSLRTGRWTTWAVESQRATTTPQGLVFFSGIGCAVHPLASTYEESALAPDSVGVDRTAGRALSLSAAGASINLEAEVAPLPGDTLYNASTDSAVGTVLTVVGATVTVSPALGATAAGDNLVFSRPIAVTVEPLPLDGGDALSQKHFQEVGFALDESESGPTSASISFARDAVSPLSQTVPVRSYASGTIRTPVPRNYRRSSLLRAALRASGHLTVRGVRVRTGGEDSERTNR